MARSLAGDRVELDDVVVVFETKNAIRILYEGEEHWMPKSAVHADSPVYKVEDEGDMIVHRWWAKKAGWLDE